MVVIDSDKIYTIVHRDYKKVVDILMWLDINYVLTFTTELFRKVKDKDQIYYHSEIGYLSDNSFSININRYFSYYLTIDNKGKNRSDIGVNQIRIDNTNFYQFTLALDAVSKWLTDSAYSNLFIRRNNVIKIGLNIESVKINGVFENTIMEFTPEVVNNNGEYITGIAIFINNMTEPIFMSSSKFMNFRLFISTFNMYQSAQLMLNYMGRPSIGSNFINMTDMTFGNVDTGYTPKQPIRQQIKPTKNKSFFEEMGSTKRT